MVTEALYEVLRIDFRRQNVVVCPPVKSRLLSVGPMVAEFEVEKKFALPSNYSRSSSIFCSNHLDQKSNVVQTHNKVKTYTTENGQSSSTPER